MAKPDHRTVTHETEDRRVIAVVRRSPETDQLSDEEIVARFDEWKCDQRHLRAVDDE